MDEGVVTARAKLCRGRVECRCRCSERGMLHGLLVVVVVMFRAMKSDAMFVRGFLPKAPPWNIKKDSERNHKWRQKSAKSSSLLLSLSEVINVRVSLPSFRSLHKLSQLQGQKVSLPLSICNKLVLSWPMHLSVLTFSASLRNYY